MLLNGLEARHTPGLEDLCGVGLELVVASKAGVKADDALGLVLGHGADHLQRERPLQTEEGKKRCVFEVLCQPLADRPLAQGVDVLRVVYGTRDLPGLFLSEPGEG